MEICLPPEAPTKVYTLTWMTSSLSNHRSTVGCHTYRSAQLEGPVLLFTTAYHLHTPTHTPSSFTGLLVKHLDAQALPVYMTMKM